MKKAFNYIKELRKTDKGKAIIFFGFYAIFFLIIYILAHTTTPTTSNIENDNKPYNFYADNLLKNNYNFDYIITLDELTYRYQGKRNDDTSIFTYNNEEYKLEKDIFTKDNQVVDNPFIVKEFLDVSSLLNIIDNATYEAKTSYESGKTTYSFLISTNTINKILNDNETDFEEVPNRLIVGTDENKNINQIIINLDSYCTLNEFCQKSLKIELQYDFLI